MMYLADKSVLVTGATGFIGGHLAQRLAEEGAQVTGLGRNLDAVPLLRGRGVRLERADLLDFRQIRTLLEGQDIVFHVAAWLGPRHGGTDMAWTINVFATLQLVKMAAEAGISRFVNVSSIAAYGPPDCDVMDEDHPLPLRQNGVYGSTKAEGEIRGMQTAAERGIEWTSVRPGIVYGPGSRAWSIRMVRLLQSGVPLIFGRGDGHAQPVYIDNLIDLILRLATANAAVGEAFNAVDGPMTWREWFGCYGEMCGRKPRRLPLSLARLALDAAHWLPTGLTVDRDLATYYAAQAVYPMTKAERLLGYRRAIDFDEGMRRTEAWLRAEGYLSRR